MPLDHADRARLAHRVLRLRESGLDSEGSVRALADEGEKSAGALPPNHTRAILNALRDGDTERATELAEAQVVTTAPVGPPLGRVAIATVDLLDEDRPGPTERATVEDLFGLSLDDIWKVWDEAVTANLEETLDDEVLEHWRESVERDQRSFEEKKARLEETGDWPVHPYFGHNRHDAGAANALYDEGREGFLVGAIDWDTAVFKVDLVDSADYTVNLATHEFRSSVAAAAREESSGALANKTFAAGVADADDITYTAAAGDPCEALVIYQASAVGGGGDVADTAQRLVAYIDTATGLPITLNGGNVNVVWDSGSNRIFKL